MTSRVLEAVVGMGPGVWGASVFDVLAFRALTSRLFGLWSGGPLIAKVI